MSKDHDITDAIDLVRASLKGFSPYDYEDFGWSDWISGPLKRIMPCSCHLDDDFDSTMIAKMIENQLSSSIGTREMVRPRHSVMPCLCTTYIDR